VSDSDELLQLTVTLLLGTTTPAPASSTVMQALRGIEVVQGCRCPSGFRLSFSADRYPPVTGPLTDYPLLSGGDLNPFVRVQITVNTGSGLPLVLMDGFITRQEVTIDEHENATITVIGEDVSVKMDLFEAAAEFPSLTDSAIVTQILGSYAALGVTPSVTAPSGETAPSSWVPQQNSTDRYYLQMLAARHAYLFYVQPGSVPGVNTAYWGPPVTTGDRQPALTTNMRGVNNLRRISLSYDALAATVTYGQVLDLTQTPAVATPIAIGSATQVPGLSTGTALPSAASGLAAAPSSYSSQVSTLAVRGTLLLHPGLAPTDAQSVGQAKTNRSVQEVAVVEGELDVEEYGAVLTAPGLVDLRGVGQLYDGTYYVKQVTHVLSLEDDAWSYLQRFLLTRGGTGSTILMVEET
jgi:phage protein D